MKNFDYKRLLKCFKGEEEFFLQRKCTIYSGINMNFCCDIDEKNNEK
jgi:hypothetical protein